MTLRPHKLVALLVLCSVFGSASAADPASEDPLRRATLKLIEALVEQGVLTREKADALIREASQPAPTPAPSAPAAPGTAPSAEASAPAGTIRVPYVPQFVRDEIKDEVRQDLVAQAHKEGWAAPGAVPDWVRRMEWDGDLRIRVQDDAFPAGNAPAVSISGTNSARSLTLLNTTETVNRERVRARFGFTDDLDDQTTVGLRVATGSASDPLSENQTLGNYETRYQIALDRAYLRYNALPWLSASAGRFENPLVGTDLVWAPDLSFDGFYVKAAPHFGATQPFLTYVASPVQEIDLGFNNKYLFAVQGGATQDFGGPKATVALGYYRYVGVEGVVSPAGTSLYEYTAPVFTQKGNTYYNISANPATPLLGLASAYHELDLTGSVDAPVMGPYHAGVAFDVVKNLGFDAAAVSARVGAPVQAKTLGYMLRLNFGNTEMKNFGNWQVYAAYKHLERDAVLDAFTDPDFHLGGTDAKGYVLGGNYGIARNTWASLRYYSTDAISGAPFAIDTIQLDLNTRF